MVSHDLQSALAPRHTSAWSVALGILVGLLLVLLFFRSVLPRLPQIFLRGKLRIHRLGLRGIRGLEYRSKGFHNDSAAFSASGRDGQFELRVQRIYASWHLPSLQPYQNPHAECAPLKRRRAVVTIHVQGVGIRLPRSDAPNDSSSSTDDGTDDQQEQVHISPQQRLEQEEEERLQRLMSSPPMSPVTEAPQSIFQTSSMHREPDTTEAGTPPSEPNAGLSTAAHRAGFMSLCAARGCMDWFSGSAVPTVRSFALRVFRAALFVLTSSLPVLTSLVSVEVDRMEIYVQEAEAVTRIGRAGVTFTMSPASQTAEQDATSERVSVAPTWGQYLQALRSMPTRAGFGARGAVSYLAAGMSPSKVSVHLRLESILVFEAQFPERLYLDKGRAHSRFTSLADTGRSFSPKSHSSSLRPGMTAESSKDADDSADLSVLDESTDWSDGYSTPRLKRSTSASRLRKMSSMTLRGFTDRWADWALEPLTSSDFSSDTGWARKYINSNVASRHLSDIPSSARLLFLPKVTQLSAGLLLGSNFALGGDETLDAKVALGNINVGLDAVLRVLKVVEERKARRRGWAPQDGANTKERSMLSKHLVKQHPSVAPRILGVLSSVSLMIPSLNVETSSAAILAMAEADSGNNASHKPPSSYHPFTLKMSMTGFNLDMKTSNPCDDMHRHWIGTCGIVNAANDLERSVNSRIPSSRRQVTVEHRRAFQADLDVASFDLHCQLQGRQKESHLFFVGDLSAGIRSTWTPFGLYALTSKTSSQSRLLFATEPNEHVVVAETSLAEIKSDVSLPEIAALLRLADDFKAGRAAIQKRLDIDEQERPKTELEKLRNVPRIAAGVNVRKTSLQLDASTDDEQRTLVVALPNIDLTFNAEYYDEYVKRPLAEKRVAYKALRNDELEWPLSGISLVANQAKEQINGADLVTSTRGSSKRAIIDTQLAEQSDLTPESGPNPERYAEENLSMEETLSRMLELQQQQQQPPGLSRRTTIRDMMAKSGKVRTPGYTRRSSMAAETRFSLRYQFETSFRVEAIEAYITVAAGNTLPSPRQPSRESPNFTATQYHLLALHSFEVAGSGRVPGSIELLGPGKPTEIPCLSASDAVAEFRTSVEDVDVEFWHPCVLETCSRIASSLVRRNGQDNSRDSHPSPDKSQTDNSNGATPTETPLSESRPLVERLPGGLTLYVSIGRTIARFGGVDERINDKIARGIGFECSRTVLEYTAVTETKSNVLTHKVNWGSRSALELPEDIQLQAISLASRHGRAALARAAFHDAGIFPILDAEQATKQQAQEGFGGPPTEGHPLNATPSANAESTSDKAEKPATSLLSDNLWQFKSNSDNVHKASQHRPRFQQQDRSNFIVFMPFAAVKVAVRPPNVKKKSGLTGATDREVMITTEDINLLAFKIDLLHTYCLLLTISVLKRLASKISPRSSAGSASSRKAARPLPDIGCRFDIKDVHVSVTLPKSVHLFLRIRRLEVRQDVTHGLSVYFETVMGAVESPKQHGQELWEEAVRLRDWKVTVAPKAPNEKPRVEVNGDGALIRVPYGYAVNPIIDNTSVAFKATKQLIHQFLSDDDGSIIAPTSEEPKHLPDISINIRVLTLEAQDDPFETRLNIIWRAGMAENLAREEREAAFRAKAEAVLMSDYPRRSTASFQSAGSGTSVGSSFEADDDNATTASDDSHYSTSRGEVSIAEARAALDAYNSSSWFRRYNNAQSEQTRRQESVLKNIYGRFLMSKPSEDLPIRVTPIGKAAPLFRSIMYQLSLKVTQPSFPAEQLRDFIHEKGAGIPKDTPFSLLVPMHMNWEMEEWRITLRDYPMPLLHVPPTHRKDKTSPKAWQFDGDIVIAEQLGGPESIRHVPAVIVPAATGHPDAIEYGIVIPKVAMSVKMYGAPEVSIKTPYPTRLVWGQSLQPTIQDVVRVIDGLTPPPHDPSPKLGFWDKLPLILHGHIKIKFEDEGGFNIHLKGSRDPYRVEVEGAGWVKSWKGNVELRIGHDNPQKEFFQILSQDYILAIPDLADYTDQAATGVLGRPSSSEHHHEDHERKAHEALMGSSTRRYMKDPAYTKIVIKLTNGVRWGAGLHGERTCYSDTCSRLPPCKGDPFYRECRNFERIPHWEVITKTREHFDSLPESDRTDSFRGWRSHHLHLSLSVYSSKTGLQSHHSADSANDVANNFYFTPFAWAHFWAWMRLFNSAMGLPIRSGSLFPESPPPSPKFGRFIGTIKYKLDLAPLFITHQYLQHSKKDWARDVRTHVGVKARLGSFALDMHQRQQETIKDRPELGGPRIVFHKPFYEAEVDCRQIDLKTLAGQFFREGSGQGDQDDEEIGGSALDDLLAEETGASDVDLEWVDMEDFVELGLPPVKSEQSRIRMFPALICPQFHYYRKIESRRERRDEEKKREAENGDTASTTSRTKRGNEIEELLSKLEQSKFGNEPTHSCIVGKSEGPYAVQRRLAQERLHFIREEIGEVLNSHSERSRTSEEMHSPSRDPEAEDDHQQHQLQDLHNREKLLGAFITHLGRLQEHADAVEKAVREGKTVPTRSSTIDRNFSIDKQDLTSLYRDLGTFDNRYIAHDPTLFYSNSTRTLLLKYYYSSRFRRGYAHHMTATAVRYIRDLLNKKNKTGGQNGKSNDAGSGKTRSSSTTPNTEGGPEGMLQELLEDTVKHLEMNGDREDASQANVIPRDTIKTMNSEVRATDGISDEFTVKKSNVCLLIKPQIVLKSDLDEKSTVIISAQRTRLQNYTVQDESCAEDSVNAIVLRRNFFALDGLQCFHPNAKCRFLKNAQRRYGFVFLPIETMVDMQGHTHDFDRIVPHTDASVYYDKFNKLRLSDSSRSVATFGDDGKPVHDHLHHHMDMIQLMCPRFSVSANSEQFAALYNVVTDLILYRDPAHRDHAKRLEEMMFSYDFTDVSGLADVVSALQVRIREASSLGRQYYEVALKLNEKGRAEFTKVKGEILDLVEELNLIMDAITTSQDSQGGADREKKSALRFMTQAQDIGWNMMGDKAGQLLAKLAVKGVSFSWLNKADNSAANTLSITDLQALNVHPEAVFAEIIAKHLRAPDHPMSKEGRFLDAMWSVLAPVGGISIIDQFEFHLHPVKIQLEMLLGRKIMDYIFGTKRQRQKQEEEQKRIDYEVRKKEASPVKKKSPFARLLGSRKSQSASASDRESDRGGSMDLPRASKDTSSSTRPSSEASRDDDADASALRKSKTLKGRSSRNSLARPDTPNSRNGGDDSDEDHVGDQYAIAQRNAAEMRSRASSFRTFVYVKISDTIFCLSYKGEKQRSITDMYDLVFRTPNFEYHNSTFGYIDLADNFKKDVIKAAWNQKSTLLKDIITHRPNKKRYAIESIKAIRQVNKMRDASAPVEISVEPPTPSHGGDGDDDSLMESPISGFSIGDEDEDEQHDSDEDSSTDTASISDRRGERAATQRRSQEESQGNILSRTWGRRHSLGREAADDGGQSSRTSSQASGRSASATPELDDPTPHQEHTNPALQFSASPSSEKTPHAERPERTESGLSSLLHPLSHKSSAGGGSSDSRRTSLSARSQSPSAFKLNKLLPKSLRSRSVSTASGSGNPSSNTSTSMAATGSGGLMSRSSSAELDSSDTDGDENESRN